MSNDKIRTDEVKIELSRMIDVANKWLSNNGFSFQLFDDRGVFVVHKYDDWTKDIEFLVPCSESDTTYALFVKQKHGILDYEVRLEKRITIKKERLYV